MSSLVNKHTEVITLRMTGTFHTEQALARGTQIAGEVRGLLTACKAIEPSLG